MKDLQDLLNKFDIAFLSINKKSRPMIYIFLIFALVGITYNNITPKNIKIAKKLQTQVKTITASIKSNRHKIENNEEQKVFLKEVERSNESIQESIKEKELSKNYINKKIEQQHNIKFSAKQWGIFYKVVQKKAKKHHIGIVSIDNEKVTPISFEPQKLTKTQERIKRKKHQKSFQPIFKMEIVAETTFRNLINFLIDIEDNRLITKIEKLTLNNNGIDKLKTTIEINLWGIR